MITDDDHWLTWHTAYDDPSSSHSRRLRRVQSRLSDALARAPEGPLSLISSCAGDGRDVLAVLDSHPRARDVRALLVELDPTLAARARDGAAQLHDAHVTVVHGDASTTSAFATHVPAHIALFCGVFGNISDDDIRTTVMTLPSLVSTGSTVIWTRHKRAPDLTGTVREWFAEAGFAEVAFDTEEGHSYGVGTHVLDRPPDPFEPGRRMFTFVGDGSGAF